VTGASSVTTKNLNVDGSQAYTDGGFLYVQNSAASAITIALTINSVIKNTLALGNGGVFFVDSANTYLDMRDTVSITACKANSKGGIAYISRASNVDIFAGTFQNV